VNIGYVLDRWLELSQTFIVEEIGELERQGVAVTVVALHETATPTARPALFLRRTPKGSLPHARCHLRWMVRSPRRYLQFLQAVRGLPHERAEIAWKRLPWIAELLRESGVDRLHAHFAWGGAAAAHALSALTGWPWALTVHARDIYAPKPGLPIKLDSCDLLVTVCQYNVDLLRKQHGVRRPIEVVVCGVTPPSTFEPSSEEIDVIAVGRLVEKKGFDILLRAFRDVLAVRPHATLELIGTGPLADDLRKLAGALHLNGQLTLAGAQPHADVLRRISQARVLCLPARVAKDGDADSMPLVIKEAMARGLPVVATAVTAIPEMVDEQVGVLVLPGDERQLAAALLRLLDDVQLCHQLGAAGRKRVEDKFTLSGEVSRLHSALQRMAS
jgi:colanic acid/amylovoran biosynthesis glycosyltransferase